MILMRSLRWRVNPSARGCEPFLSLNWVARVFVSGTESGAFHKGDPTRIVLSAKALQSFGRE